MIFQNRIRMKYDSIIFDLDGTLWDMSAACVKSYNRVVTRNKIPFRELTSDDLKKVVGRPHDECIEEIFSDLSDSQRKTLDQETSLEDMVAIREEEINLYPGVKIGLGMLARKFPLYIVSNCQSGYIETFYESSGLQPLFKDQECYGNTGEMKAQNIQRVMDRNHLKSPIYVGDTVGDGRAARACGIPFIHVRYGYALDVECDFAAHSFEDVVSFLLSPEPQK